MTFRKAREIIPDALPEHISQLRHPLEWPAYVILVGLVPIALAVGYFLFIGYAAFVIVIVFAFVLFREIQRREVHANSVKLSRDQFPEIYERVERYSAKLGLKRAPDVYVTSGNGVLNAYATETWGKAYIVLHSELFSNQPESIMDGLEYIIGHELSHIRLKHTSIFYFLPLAPWIALQMIPMVGPALAFPYNVLRRFTEYSCDRAGAHLAEGGLSGLVLLTAGRYVYDRVEPSTFLAQCRSRETRGRWTGVAELFSTHPFAANRVRSLYELGFLKEPPAAPNPEGATLP